MSGVSYMVHVDRERALDRNLSVFDLRGILVVFHVVGCHYVARGAGGFNLDELEKEDLGVDALRYGSLEVHGPSSRRLGNISGDAQLARVMMVLDELRLERSLHCRHLELLL